MEPRLYGDACVYCVLQGIGQLVEDFAKKKAQLVFINIQVTSVTSVERV